MQTFVPYPDLNKIVKCLDYRRLNKQRLESKQILRCLQGTGSLGWRHHPAIKMWKGHEGFLTAYMNAMITEWIGRGYKNTLPLLPVENTIEPMWWGGRIHSTHRAALLAKNFDYYSQFDWKELPEIKYFWPKNT